MLPYDCKRERAARTNARAPRILRPHLKHITMCEVISLPPSFKQSPMIKSQDPFHLALIFVKGNLKKQIHLKCIMPFLLKRLIEEDLWWFAIVVLKQGLKQTERLLATHKLTSNVKKVLNYKPNNLQKTLSPFIHLLMRRDS